MLGSSQGGLTSSIYTLFFAANSLQKKKNNNKKVIDFSIFTMQTCRDRRRTWGLLL